MTINAIDRMNGWKLVRIRADWFRLYIATPHGWRAQAGGPLNYCAKAIPA